MPRLGGSLGKHFNKQSLKAVFKLPQFWPHKPQIGAVKFIGVFLKKAVLMALLLAGRVGGLTL